MSDFRWAAVTGTSPIRVQLDGDAAPLALTPDSLVDPLALAVGDRVRCELQNKRVIIHGRSAGNALSAGNVSWTVLITPPSGWLLCDGSAVSRTTYATLFAACNPTVGTATVTIASPGVWTRTAHGLFTGQMAYLTTAGALPTGLSVNTAYFVIRVDANTFRLATTLANATAGTAINTTGSQSGIHTVRRTFGVGDGSTTFNLPNLAGKIVVGGDTTQAEFDALGETGGEKTHVLTTPEMPSHTHAPASGSLLFIGTGGAGLAAGSNVGSSAATAATGGGSAHNNLQPYIVLNPIIKS